MPRDNVLRTSRFHEYGRRANARSSMIRGTESSPSIFATVQNSGEIFMPSRTRPDPDGVYFASLLSRLDGVE